MLKWGTCKVDLFPCDPDNKVCRLNPADPDPYIYDTTSGARLVFYNRMCSNFKAVAK